MYSEGDSSLSKNKIGLHQGWLSSHQQFWRLTYADKHVSCFFWLLKVQFCVKEKIKDILPDAIPHSRTYFQPVLKERDI
jgi:hypothetical protein